MDQLFGGEGDDTLYAGFGDIVDGGAGRDTLHISMGGAAAAVTMTIDSDNAALFAATNVNQTNIEVLQSFRATELDDILTVIRSDRAFIVDGGGGNDRLIGSDGDNNLHGGAGDDVFVFADGDFGGLTAGTADRIADFEKGKDKIDLKDDYGNQAFTFVGTNEFSDVAGQLRYEIVGNTTFIMGDTNGDGVEDFLITLTGQFALQASDFVL